LYPAASQVGPVTTTKTSQNGTGKTGCYIGSYSGLHVPDPRGRHMVTERMKVLSG